MHASVVAGLMAWVIADGFTTTFTCCVDTIYISAFVDMESNHPPKCLSNDLLALTLNPKPNPDPNPDPNPNPNPNPYPTPIPNQVTLTLTPRRTRTRYLSNDLVALTLNPNPNPDPDPTPKPYPTPNTNQVPLQRPARGLRTRPCGGGGARWRLQALSARGRLGDGPGRYRPERVQRRLARAANGHAGAREPRAGVRGRTAVRSRRTAVRWRL